MAIPLKEIPAFSEGGRSTSTSLLFAICLEAKKSGNGSELRALAKDAAAHMKWVLREENGLGGEILTQLEQHGVDAVKNWKTSRAMVELKKKFQMGSDLVQLMLEEKQETVAKRKREDKLIEGIEELASLAKRLKEDHAKPT